MDTYIAHPKYWIVPCNVKMFDVVSYLGESNELTVKQGRNVTIGDIVYLYIGMPYSRIMYKCIVSEADILITDLSQAESYAISKSIRQTPFMRLLIKQRFNNLSLGYANLRENGLRTVQSQQAVPPETLAYIQTFE